MKRCVLWIMIAALGCGLLLMGCQKAKSAEATANVPSPGTADVTPAASEAPTAQTIEVIYAPSSTATPVPTPEPTPSPSPTPDPTDTPTPAPTCLHGADHPDVFSADMVTTEMSYTSPNVSIQVTKLINPEGFPEPMVAYVADIYVEDVTSIRTAISSTTLTYSGVHPMIMKDFAAREKNAVLLINGDYSPKRKTGCAVVVKNNEVLRQINVSGEGNDHCLLLKDGSMVMLESSEVTIDKVLSLDPWQTFVFGPSLLDENGKAREKLPSSLQPPNPRTAIGYYAPGHYCFVVVDGRLKGHSTGMTLTETAKFMESLGCAAAYNLDGGGSTVMWLNGIQINKPSSIRELTDVVYICEPEPELLSVTGAN